MFVANDNNIDYPSNTIELREEGFVHAHRLRLPRRRTRRRATENLYPQNRDAGAACFACGRKLIRARAHDRLQHCKSDSAVSHQFGHRPLWLQPCVRVALGYLACRNPQLHRKKNQPTGDQHVGWI